PLRAHFAHAASVSTRHSVDLIHHRVEGFLQLKDLAAHVDGDLARQVAAGDSGGHFGDVAHLRRQVAGHRIDAVGQVLPSAANAGHLRLPAKLAFGADFAGDARDFGRERVELIDHRIERVFQLENFATHVDGDLAREVAARDSGGYFGDVADLTGQVRRHRVDAIGEVLPGAGDAAHQCLSAELAFGADLARHTRDFAGERIELVHHRIDGVLELENFAAHVDRDLFRQVAAGDRRRHFGDVAHLRGKVGGHRVDRVGQILPRAGHAEHVGLTAELAFGADFAGDAGDLTGERIELIPHRVDGPSQLEDFAPDVDRNLFRQIAAGDRGRHLGDVAHLRSQVRRHEVDAVGQVLPGAADSGNLRLPAELALGADFA